MFFKEIRVASWIPSPKTPPEQSSKPSLLGLELSSYPPSRKWTTKTRQVGLTWLYRRRSSKPWTTKTRLMLFFSPRCLRPCMPGVIPQSVGACSLWYQHVSRELAFAFCGANTETAWCMPSGKTLDVTRCITVSEDIIKVFVKACLFHKFFLQG